MTAKKHPNKQNSNEPVKPLNEPNDLQALEQKIVTLEEELELEKQSRLRAYADYQNLERRIERDKERISQMAKLSAITTLISILDDHNRALTHMENSEATKRYYEGLLSLRNKIVTVLNNLGVNEIECNVGESYDSSKFEAVGTLAVASQDMDNKVAEIVEKGYKFNTQEGEQIIRNARVLVGKYTTS